jgi:hypothetical protein
LSADLPGLFDPREATLWHASLLAIREIIGGYFERLHDLGARNPSVGSLLQSFSAEPSSWLRRGATAAATADVPARCQRTLSTFLGTM